jgi:hypothetical protein
MRKHVSQKDKLPADIKLNLQLFLKKDFVTCGGCKRVGIYNECPKLNENP